MNQPAEIFSRLMQVIADRKANPPARSYTTSLFAAGVPKIGAKLLEEAHEVIEAAGEPESPEARQHLVHEAADVLYHLFVLMGYRDITLDEVASELGRRFGVSGIDEKESRQQVSERPS